VFEVHIDAPGKVFKEKLFSDDTFQKVQDAVQRETGTNLQLFHNKKKVKESSTIGSVCKEAECHVFALDPSDEERRRKFFTK
jgi:hypothetical protein